MASDPTASLDFETLRQTLESQVLEERKFLHEISSPVATLFFVMETVTEALSENSTVSAEDRDSLAGAQKELVRIREMITKRRTLLHERTDWVKAEKAT